eukprot:350404-Chlamydomonas_euryale.AAC.3
MQYCSNRIRAASRQPVPSNFVGWGGGAELHERSLTTGSGAGRTLWGSTGGSSGMGRKPSGGS